MKKLVILEAEGLGGDVDLTPFTRVCDTVIYPKTKKEEIRERCADAELVLVNKCPMNRETIGGLPKLKYIGVTATGTNNIDWDYMKEAGITVTNAAGYSTNSVAQHTFALLFYLLEKLPYYDQYVRSGEYTKSGEFTHLGRMFFELSGKTWGIIGLGAIGRQVARIASAFGCRVIYYSASGKNKNPDYEQVSIEELLAQSDVVSVHAPLTPQTEKLMNYDAFCRMKNSAYFINVGRGPIVDEGGLVRALKENQIAGAGLDVMSAEPLTADNPLNELLGDERLLVTPHIAWGSIEARRHLMEIVYQNLEEFLGK